MGEKKSEVIELDKGWYDAEVEAGRTVMFMLTAEEAVKLTNQRNEEAK